MDKSGWKRMKGDKSVKKEKKFDENWRKPVNECGWKLMSLTKSELKFMIIDFIGWKKINVDASGWK